MGRYLASRAVQIAITLVIMSLVVYLLIGLMPGDPIDLMISGNPKMTAEDAKRLRALFGVDRPLLERYLAWAHQALLGNFGYSRSFNRPVLEVLWPRLLNTFQLAGLAFLISTAIALPLGVWAAARPRSRADYLVNLLCFAGISTPTFWLALLLISLFAVKLGWLPAGGMADPRAGTPFLSTARAKGVAERHVLMGHAFANALTPVLTVLALSFGALFSGAMITETMFAWPGMGAMIYQAIQTNDFNLALVGLLLATFATVAGNLLADVALAAIDPRVSLADAA